MGERERERWGGVRNAPEECLLYSAMGGGGERKKKQHCNGLFSFPFLCEKGLEKKQPKTGRGVNGPAVLDLGIFLECKTSPHRPFGPVKILRPRSSTLHMYKVRSVVINNVESLPSCGYSPPPPTLKDAAQFQAEAS